MGGYAHMVKVALIFPCFWTPANTSDAKACDGYTEN